MMEETSGFQPSENELKLMMESVDINGDGFITFDEFCELMSDTNKEQDAIDIKQAFDFLIKITMVI
eukprot:UN27067